MHVIVDPKEITKICEIASFIKSSTSPSPAKGLITFKAQKNEVVARVDNIEQMVLYKLNAKVIEDGEALVPANRLIKFSRYEKGKFGIQTLKNKSVELYTVDKNLSIKLYPPEMESIPIPEHTEPNLSLGTDFIQATKYALQCVSDADSRPVLNGVCFNYKDDILNMASADGFRLVHVKHSVKLDSPEFDVIIPALALRVLKFMTGDIKCALYSSGIQYPTPVRISFKAGNITLISQLINGTYPKYLQLIPTAKPTWSFTVSSPLLCQRLNQLNSDNLASGTIRLQNGDKYLTISAGLVDFEYSECIIPADNQGSGDGKIAVNIKYLLEAAKIYSELNIKTTSPSSPLLLTGDLRNVTMVIMPMFVQW
jgi:DNA polymerase-3 subunit beta